MTMGMNKPHRTLIERPSPWTSPARRRVVRRRWMVFYGLAIAFAVLTVGKYSACDPSNTAFWKSYQLVFGNQCLNLR